MDGNRKLKIVFKIAAIIIFVLALDVFEIGVMIPSMVSDDSNISIALAIIVFLITVFINIMMVFKINLLLDDYVDRNKVKHKRRFY